ncbi:hypothetical protein [Burkholderia vietnamiensis]|nr:hypothetical protein [Burkholderia vietnamiensis]
MTNRVPGPMPLWKIVLLWLAVGVGCVIWTLDDMPPESSSATYRT